MPLAEIWTVRLRTARAMVLLCLARATVALAPFGLWRRTLGCVKQARKAGDRWPARRLAAHIARGAWRLPFAVKCLPQAMALSWQLRRRSIPHRVVIAVRPQALRGDDDALHAWVECEGVVILGELPGPWIAIHTTPVT